MVSPMLVASWEGVCPIHGSCINCVLQTARYNYRLVKPFMGRAFGRPTGGIQSYRVVYNELEQRIDELYPYHLIRSASYRFFMFPCPLVALTSVDKIARALPLPRQDILQFMRSSEALWHIYLQKILLINQPVLEIYLMGKEKPSIY